MNKQGTNWKWREDEITMKEFYNLSQQEKNEYLVLVEGLKKEERSSMDEILLNRFGRTKSSNKFFTLEPE